MTLAMYQTYKESGIEWIGHVPETWSLKRVSWLFQLVGSGTTPPSDVGHFYGDGTPWVTTGELREGVIDATTKSVTQLALSTFPMLRVYDPGTLLIAMYGATIGRLAVLGVSACTNQACCAMSKPRNVLPGFAFFALLAARTHIVELAVGGSQPNINQEMIRSLRLPVPPESEQRQIANYLDSHTAKIDVLIEKQERLIETLAGRREAVISHAVTKGLDPNAPMKDSGIDWMGNVPSSWSIAPLKSLATVGGGFIFDSADFLPMGNTPVVKQGDLFQSNFATFTNRVVASHYMVRSGDVLVAMSGDFKSVLWARGPAALNQRSAYLRAKGGLVEPKWLSYALPFVLTRLERLNASTTIKNLSSIELLSARICVPTIQLQQQIIRHLNRETAQLDALSAKAREMIDVLKERRQALISAAVTGKIDVRGLS